MTAKQIQQAIRKRPFRPYVIETMGGESYRVGHPEAIWQAQPPEETTVILQDREHGVIFLDTSSFAAIVFPADRTKSQSKEPE